MRYNILIQFVVLYFINFLWICFLSACNQWDANHLRSQVINKKTAMTVLSKSNSHTAQEIILPELPHTHLFAQQNLLLTRRRLSLSIKNKIHHIFCASIDKIQIFPHASLLNKPTESIETLSYPKLLKILQTSLSQTKAIKNPSTLVLSYHACSQDKDRLNQALIHTTSLWKTNNQLPVLHTGILNHYNICYRFNHSQWQGSTENLHRIDSPLSQTQYCKVQVIKNINAWIKYLYHIPTTNLTEEQDHTHYTKQMIKRRFKSSDIPKSLLAINILSPSLDATLSVSLDEVPSHLQQLKLSMIIEGTLAIKSIYDEHYKYVQFLPKISPQTLSSIPMSYHIEFQRSPINQK